MRAHGVQDFPDPGSKVGTGPGGQLDPARWRPRGTGRPGGDPDTESELAFAPRMRASGIAGFPDPNADGQFPEAQMRISGKGSPPFTAAQDACQRYLDSPTGGQPAAK